MKKISLFLSFLFCAVLSITAQNKLSIADVAIVPGDAATITVKLDAASAIEDQYISLDITPSEGLSYDVTSCKAANGVNATFKKRNNGDLRVGIQALSAKAGSSDLFSFTISASADFVSGTLSVSNATIGDDDVADFSVNVAALKGATVTIDAPEMIKIISAETHEAVALSSSMVLPAGDYSIATSEEIGAYKIYSVTKNGVPVANPAMLSVAEGDVIVITANYPAQFYTVTFNDYTGVIGAGTETRVVAPVKGDAGFAFEYTLQEGYTATPASGFYLTQDTTITVTAPVQYATVTIDNPSKVKIISEENREGYTLVAGNQSFSAGEYMITPAYAGYTINKVTLNGEEVKAPFGNYQVELAANDTLVITADYDPAEIKAQLAIANRKNIGECVKSVQHSGAAEPQINGWFSGNFDIAAGYQMTVILDEDHYQIDSVLVNDVKIAGSYGAYTVNVKGESIQFDIYGSVYAPELQMTSPQATTKVNEIPSKVMFMFNQELKGVEAAAIQAGENDPIMLSNFEVIDGNTAVVYVDSVTAASLANGNITVYVKLLNVETPAETNFIYAPEFAVKSSVLGYKGGRLVFNENVDINTDNQLVACYVSGVKTKNIACQAVLMLDDDNFDQINVEFSEALPEGEYTLDIEDGIIISTSEEPLASVQIPFTVVKPELQVTYPQANTKVNAIPEYVTFMFNAETPSIYSAAIGVGENEPIIIDRADIDVIDGNTVKIAISEKVKEQLPETTGGFTVYLQLTEDWVYDTYFTVSPEFAVESSSFTKTGGQIVFNENVDFADGATEVKCYVSGVKTKNIATQATLTLDDDNFAAINVEFDDELEDGEYTLDIEDGQIISAPGEEPLASVKISFTIGAATGIKNIVIVTGKDGKYLSNGKLVIVKAGKAYNANGAQLK